MGTLGGSARGVHPPYSEDAESPPACYPPIQLGGLGERCKLPQWVRAKRPPSAFRCFQSEKTSFLTMYYTSCSQAKCTVIIMINCAGASNHNLVFNCEKLKPQ